MDRFVTEKEQTDSQAVETWLQQTNKHEEFANYENTTLQKNGRDCQNVS